MDATQIIIAAFGVLGGIIGTLMTSKSKKDDTNRTADDFTFKSLQSENKRLSEKNEALENEIDMLRQTIEEKIDVVIELKEKVSIFATKAKQLEEELELVRQQLENA